MPIAEAINDPFDLDSLRVTAATDIGTEKVILQIPVRKPGKQEWFRVNPDPDYTLDTSVVEMKEEREVYLLAPHLRNYVPDQLSLVRLHTVVNRAGVISLWPAKLPTEDGRVNGWHSSALEIAEHAKTEWVRMSANMGLGGYEMWTAKGDLPEPVWPEKSFQELLKIAFKETYIRDENHFILRKLAGEI